MRFFQHGQGWPFPRKGSRLESFCKKRVRAPTFSGRGDAAARTRFVRGADAAAEGRVRATLPLRRRLLRRQLAGVQGLHAVCFMSTPALQGYGLSEGFRGTSRDVVGLTDMRPSFFVTASRHPMNAIYYSDYHDARRGA